MASLVADYGTSSGSDSEDETTYNFSQELDENNENEKDDKMRINNKKINQNEINKLPLPTPDFNGTPKLKTSVFLNPFSEAEKAKSAILEKHVKMTPTLDDTKMINGRKICWNYRKGRCRYGHNCTFAHDSDLHRNTNDLETIRNTEETVICQTHFNNNNNNHDDDEIYQENNQILKKNKKRPGLTQGLVPGKKVIKMYKAQANAVGR